MGITLEARHLSFSWSRGRADWLKDLGLSIDGGHIYGLMGRNGAGKTTLIKLLSGCLRPTTGDVRLVSNGGRLDVINRTPETLSEIVFVPENSDLPGLSVREFGRLTGSLYPKFSMERYLGNLQVLEVPLQGKLPSLSFGQRRKAHIAFALATEASMIFLDEPSNGLDIAAQIVLRRLLIAHQSSERSLIVSTHHVREFENVIDQVIVLDQGRVLANESIGRLQESTDFKDLENWYARLIGITSLPLTGGRDANESL